MSREVCGICWCPYDEDTGECACKVPSDCTDSHQPVAWMCPEDPERETAFNWKAGHCENCGRQRIPLYTAPPQRKPLTDDEIADAANSVKWSKQYHVDFARAIERAHGIGEKK